MPVPMVRVGIMRVIVCDGCVHMRMAVACSRGQRRFVDMVVVAVVAGAAMHMAMAVCQRLMSVDVRGSGAWNMRTQVIAPHFGKYRIFWAMAQRRSYGR